MLLALVLIFPFTPNPSALNIKRDLMLTREQELAIEATVKLKDKVSKVRPLVYNHLYLSEVLNIDHFDHSKRMELDSNEIPAPEKRNHYYLGEFYTLSKNQE